MVLKINLTPVTSDTQVLLQEIDAQDLANVSDVSSVTKGYITGNNGFRLSSVIKSMSKLDGTAPLFSSQGYPGILSRTLSNEVGTTDFAVSFTIEGALSYSSYLYIGFDNVVQEYATDFEISNTASQHKIVITNNTSVFVCIALRPILMAGNNVFTLTIKKWSKPGASVRITSLSTTPTVQLTAHEIISAEWSENLLDVNAERVPGVCEQYADIRFYDRFGVMSALVQDDDIKNKYKIEILIDDEVINTYITQDWDIDTDNTIFTLKGADYYYLFSKIKIDAQSVKTRAAADMIEWIFNTAGVPFTWGTFEFSHPAVLITPNSWLYASTIGEILEKICNAFALRIYWAQDKYIVEELW